MESVRAIWMDFYVGIDCCSSVVEVDSELGTILGYLLVNTATEHLV